MADKLYTYGNTPDKKIPPIYNKDGTHDIASLCYYFAARAMTALIGDGWYGSRNNNLARGACSVTDAMLKGMGE